MPVTSRKPPISAIKSTRARLAPRVVPKPPPRIPAGYVTRDAAAVLAVLSKHRVLEAILSELFGIFPLFFDSIERVDLRTVYDDPSTLMVRVITQDIDARDRLARLDEKWWFPNEEHHKGRIHVTIGHA